MMESTVFVLRRDYDAGSCKCLPARDCHSAPSTTTSWVFKLLLETEVVGCLNPFQLGMRWWSVDMGAGHKNSIAASHA